MDTSDEENQSNLVNTNKLRGSDIEFGFQDFSFGTR